MCIRDRGEIIAFADTINAAGAAAGEFDNINNLQNAFREDEVVPSLSLIHISRFSLIVLGATAAYIGMALVLIRRFAPKNFRCV